MHRGTPPTPRLLCQRAPIQTQHTGTTARPVPHAIPEARDVGVPKKFPEGNIKNFWMNYNKSPLILNRDPSEEKSPLAKNERLWQPACWVALMPRPWGCSFVRGTKSFPLQQPREMGEQAGTWARLALRLQDQEGLDSRWEGGLRRGTPSKGDMEDICPGPSSEYLESLCNLDLGPAFKSARNSRWNHVPCHRSSSWGSSRVVSSPDMDFWGPDYRRSWLYKNISSWTFKISIYLTYVSCFRLLIKSYFNICRVSLSLQTVPSLDAIKDWSTGRSAEDPVSSGIASSTWDPAAGIAKSAWGWQQGEKRQPPPTAGAFPLLKAPITPTLLRGNIWSRS